jgi:hypothetical protein
MAYDHPTYTAVDDEALGQITGSAGVSTRYAAFTSRLIKGVVAHCDVTGTSADVLNLVTISGTATTTTAITTAGSGSPATNGTVSTALSTANGGGLLMNQGDVAYLVKGTDATLKWTAAIEVVVQPLAPVTQ